MSEEDLTTEVETVDESSGVPVLPLRDVVVYPHMVIPLFVGRDKSIVALDKAMAAGKRILLVAQKTADLDDPQPADLYEVGTLATILQLLKLPDGTVKVLVEGSERALVDRLNVGKNLVPAFAVEKGIEAAPAANTHVMIALRADFIVALQIGTVQHRLTLHAFLPQTFRHRAAAFAGWLAHPDPGGQNLVIPAHVAPLSPSRDQRSSIPLRNAATIVAAASATASGPAPASA